MSPLEWFPEKVTAVVTNFYIYVQIISFLRKFKQNLGMLVQVLYTKFKKIVVGIRETVMESQEESYEEMIYRVQIRVYKEKKNIISE